MTVIAINKFGGMIPRAGDQVIPDGMASLAENALLMSGELRGLRGMSVQESLTSTLYEIKRIYRVLNGTVTDWITFNDDTVDMVKAPLVNDTHRRYYWTSENGPPRMATLTDLLSGSNGYLLGIPAPTVAPTVSADGGTTQEVTRAYVYTFVSAYGEESAPSPATVETGFSDATWNITNIEVPDNTDRNITHVNIYRTVTTLAGGVEYHFVDQIAEGITSYADTMSTNDVAKNNTLESEFYSPPPDDLIGLVSHPNGFLVGFTERDVYFSEPYRPHAWPQEYIISTEDAIRGLGVYATSVAVCTAGHPYIATGIHPRAMTFTKAQTPNPCLSTRRGIVPMPFGVYYPSDTGLMLVSSGGFTNATQQLITKTEWVRQYVPEVIEAVRWQSQYVAFQKGSDVGFMFAPDEPYAAFVELKDFWNHSVVQNDTLSGEVFMVRDNVVYEWNPAYGLPQQYLWRSREFITPDPVNFSALIVEFGAAREISEEVIEELQEFNDIRFQYPLNPFNWHAVNQVRRLVRFEDEDMDARGNPHDGIDIQAYTGDRPTQPDNKQPFHASPLKRTADLGGSGNQVGVLNVSNTTIGGGTEYVGELTVSVYADGHMIWQSPITDEEQYRLPSGYKSRRWYFELRGTINVASFKVAETGKELGRV